MARPTTTFLHECANAARGTLALVIGNRQASSFFDFRQSGLIGSFIAVLLSMAIQAFVPQLLGAPKPPPGVATGAIILGAMVIGAQFGIAWLVLRQLGRSDGFVPFVVVQNWVTLFQSLLVVLIFAVFGQPIAVSADGTMMELTSGSVPFAAVGIASLIVTINIGRLILTLKPMHVVLFVAALLGGAFLAQAALGGVV